MYYFVKNNYFPWNIYGLRNKMPFNLSRNNLLVKQSNWSNFSSPVIIIWYIVLIVYRLASLFLANRELVLFD